MKQLITICGLVLSGALSSITHADNHPDVTGDAARGQLLFATCIACHGADAKGQKALNAPNLTGLPDWYIMRQLQNFSSGVRGASRDDVYGQQMRPMAQQLQNDQDRADVIAYINSMSAQ